MELRQIESFIALSEELHFGRAAARIGVSQPTLSQQIKRLENDIGFELFARTQRKVEITLAGEAFLVNALQLVADAAAMVNSARRVAQGETGTLNLGYVGSALFSVVPLVVQALKVQAPEIQVALQEHKTEEQLAAMRAGRLDAGFIKAPTRPVADFDVTPVFTETIGIALPAAHGLAKADRLELSQLAHEPFVIFPREAEPDTFDKLMLCCSDAGFAPEIAQTATSLQSVLGLVATGIGCAFVVESVMRNSHRDGVVFIPLEPPTPELTTAMAWPTNTNNPTVTTFETVARHALADLA